VSSLIVVAFHLGLKHHLVGGWAGGGGTSRRAERQPKCGNVPNAEWRKHTILGQSAQRDFLWRAAVPKAIALVVLRTSRAAWVGVEWYPM